MNKRILILLAALFATNALAVPVEIPTNKDGSPVTGVIAPVYDPGAGEYPLPINLAFDATDFTLTLPAEDPTDFSDPFVALGALDGFSTTEKWIMEFASDPYGLDASTIIPGHTVRMFEVSVAALPDILTVTGVVKELTPVSEFVAVASGNDVAILPTAPLKEMTTYMVVMTNDIKDTAGNDATPSDRYHLTSRAEPLVDADGNSVYPFIDNDTAALLEFLRQMHLAQEAAVAPLGISGDDIILSWTAQTQAITPVLKNIRSIAKPAPTTIVKTPLNTAAVGGLGAADIYMGVITLPYYLGVPSAENPTAPLTDFWTAAPGAYVSPADTLGLDPTSTAVTVVNPFPVVTSMQTVPVLMTVPNANSGHTKPAAGWPVVIFGHGLGNDRSYMLAVADTAAAAGYAVIAIDAPLHGITPNDPALAPLYIENTPFADVANERTFDVDYDQDGVVDDSGAYFLSLSSMLTFRDNIRQSIADWSVLAVTIPTISIDGDTLPDLDASTIQYASLSGGSIIGIPFVAIEPMVNNAFLSVPGGGLARALEASQGYGPPIRAGLAALGVEPGSSDYESFFLALQTVLDGADPINWGAEATRHNNIVLHEVLDDFLVPNYVANAPLSGTEPLIRAMGLNAYSSTQQNVRGLDLVGRFPKPANHWSFITPINPVFGTDATEAFIEMQRQFASFIASKGRAVVVTNPAVMVPEVGAVMAAPSESDVTERSSSKKAKGSNPKSPSSLMQAVGELGKMGRPVMKAGQQNGDRPDPGIGDQLQKPDRFE